MNTSFRREPIRTGQPFSEKAEGLFICGDNGYMESFIGKFRDELLNGEIFYALLEAKILTEW